MEVILQRDGKTMTKNIFICSPICHLKRIELIDASLVFLENLSHYYEDEENLAFIETIQDLLLEFEQAIVEDLERLEDESLENEIS